MKVGNPEYATVVEPPAVPFAALVFKTATPPAPAAPTVIVADVPDVS